MILISHRGNIDKKIPALENTPDYINKALLLGYDVEIDVWLVNGTWYLGHDNPEHEIKYEYLKNAAFWCHAKNIDALSVMAKDPEVHCFWHQEDDVALTSRNYLWTYPGKLHGNNSICVMPERNLISPAMIDDSCVGICSDIISDYKRLLK